MPIHIQHESYLDGDNARVQLAAIAKILGFDVTTTESTATGCKYAGSTPYFSWHGVHSGTVWKLEALIRGLIAKADKYHAMLQEVCEEDGKPTCWGEELYDRWSAILHAPVPTDEEEESPPVAAAFEEDVVAQAHSDLDDLVEAIEETETPTRNSEPAPWEDVPEEEAAIDDAPTTTPVATPAPTGNLWEDW